MTVKELSKVSYGNSDMNIVYIKENDKWVPYIAVDNNYNGNCLVVRKNVLKNLPYCSDDEGTSYYPESYIDSFLNSEFLNVFSDIFVNSIVQSQIEVTSKESLGICGKNTEKICQK